MDAMNNSLSICIPTYNRSSRLKHTIEAMIEQITKYKIPIYISDNCSTDDTFDMVCKLQEKYKYIFYSCNKENVGADSNFVAALTMSESSFSWLLGDDDLIMEKGIDTVLGVATNSDFDLILVNTLHGHSDESTSKIRVNTLCKNLYNDRAELLVDLGWHATFMSGLIFNRNIIKNGNFSRYHGTNFIHFGAIFDYLSRKDINVRWVNTPIVCNAKGAAAGYSRDKYYEFFAEKWSEVVLLLPAIYSKEIKDKCILNHAVNTGIFSLRSFLSDRSENILRLSQFLKYYRYFGMATNVSLYKIFIFCLIPRKLCSIIENLYSNMYKRLNPSTAPL